MNNNLDISDQCLFSYGRRHLYVVWESIDVIAASFSQKEAILLKGPADGFIVVLSSVSWDPNCPDCSITSGLFMSAGCPYIGCRWVLPPKTPCTPRCLREPRTYKLCASQSGRNRPNMVVGYQDLDVQ
jgi:hypothetical protein